MVLPITIDQYMAKFDFAHIMSELVSDIGGSPWGVLDDDTWRQDLACPYCGNPALSFIDENGYDYNSHGPIIDGTWDGASPPHDLWCECDCGKSGRPEAWRVDGLDVAIRGYQAMIAGGD